MCSVYKHMCINIHTNINPKKIQKRTPRSATHHPQPTTDMRHTGWEIGSIWGVPNTDPFVSVSFCFIFLAVFCKRCKTEVNQSTHLPLAARNLFHHCGGSFELHLMGATVASSQPFLLVPSHPRSYFMYKDSWHGHQACHSVLVYNIKPTSCNQEHKDLKWPLIADMWSRAVQR